MQAFLQKINYNMVFGGFACLTLACIFGGYLTDFNLLLAVPFALLFGLFVVSTLKNAYLLLLFLLPLSIEYEIGERLATDLPTEPLMIILTVVGILFFMVNPQKIDRKLLQHPITLLLFIHLCWIGVTVVFSQFFIVSLKFLVAKIWYVVSFFFLTALFIKKERDFKAVFWCILWPLLFVIAYTLIQHAKHDFGFQEANIVVRPFFRGHVSYSVMLTVFFPFLLHARSWYKSGKLERMIVDSSILLFIVAVLLAQTRASYVSLLLIPIAFTIFKYRLTRPIAGISLILILLAGAYYSIDNRFLNLAPDFETTIYHDDFDDHLFATLEGKDVSFMERVYRWIAAINMSKEHLVVGFGAGNFYNFYQYYTISSFETYVSDNPERSGVHNYFLMMLVDQGIIGLLIMLIWCIVIFVSGENIYRKTKSAADKSLIMVVLLSLMIIIVNLMVSDLIEVDKIGSFFFINMAILINMEINANLLIKEEEK